MSYVFETTASSLEAYLALRYLRAKGTSQSLPSQSVKHPLKYQEWLLPVQQAAWPPLYRHHHHPLLSSSFPRNPWEECQPQDLLNARLSYSLCFRQIDYRFQRRRNQHLHFHTSVAVSRCGNLFIAICFAIIRLETCRVGFG
jgi:hypothetical protein